MQATQQQYHTMSPIISVPYSIPFSPEAGSFLTSPFYPVFSYSTPKPPKPPKFKERKDSSTSSENFEVQTETLDEDIPLTKKASVKLSNSVNLNS
jgi:hypothetical protein